MLVVDVVLIGILLVALLVGVQRGLLASLGALIGLVLGGFAAFWLVPIVNDVWPWQNSRVIAVIALAVALMLGGAAAGGAIGAVLRRGVDRSTPLRVVDRLLGGALAVLAGALSLSLISSSVAATGTPGISTALASSQVLRAIDAVTPRPVAETLARVRSAVLDDGLPQLGVLLDLDVQPTAPPVALDDPELAVAAASVARVSGVAYACGTSATGSGFVLAPDRVVTNAHVVAGVTAPIVELPGQPAREGRIVYFDAIDDVALIAVDDLGADAIPVICSDRPGNGGRRAGLSVRRSVHDGERRGDLVGFRARSRHLRHIERAARHLCAGRDRAARQFGRPPPDGRRRRRRTRVRPGRERRSTAATR